MSEVVNEAVFRGDDPVAGFSHAEGKSSSSNILNLEGLIQRTDLAPNLTGNQAAE